MNHVQHSFHDMKVFPGLGNSQARAQEGQSKPRKHTIEFGLNIGSTSILLIFMILCLVSFSVLSIVSANADKKLSDRVVNRSTSYYTAINRAYEILSNLDEELNSCYQLAASEEEFLQTVGELRSFIVPIDSNQELHVVVSIHYPSEQDATFYTIQSLNVSNINAETMTIID